MKKSLSLILAVVLFLTMTVPVLADEIMDLSSVTVGYLTLTASGDVTSSSGIPNTGHAFLSFKNVSDSNILIGVYLVAPNEEITFGTWPNRGIYPYRHEGIWYNLESYIYHHKGGMTQRISLTEAVTQADIATINDIIEEGDEYHLTTNNCVDFALNVWNNISGYYFLTGEDRQATSSPHILRSEMMVVGPHEVDRAFPQNDKVGYSLNGTFHRVNGAAVAAIADEIINGNIHVEIG